MTIADPEYMHTRLEKALNSDHYRTMSADKKWRSLALDVWAPAFRRVWVWDYIALWAELMGEVSSRNTSSLRTGCKLPQLTDI